MGEDKQVLLLVNLDVAKYDLNYRSREEMNN